MKDNLSDKEKFKDKLIDKLNAINIHKEAIHVNHAGLERIDESVYRSVCPVCKEGLLLVRRDDETFEILEKDHCVLCGQQFIYNDIKELKKY